MMFFAITNSANAQAHPDLGGGGLCYCSDIKKQLIDFLQLF